MNQPEKSDRIDGPRTESYRTEPAQGDLPGNAARGGRDLRGSGSSLPMGGGGRATQDLFARTAPTQGRSLPGPAADDSSGLQRAMSVLKQAMPFMQRLLPLIDGNFATAMINLIASRPATSPPAQVVDLMPVHQQICELQDQHLELRAQVQEQTSSLKRVEDRLEMVREATDRNTLEQQELIEDLKAIGNKVNFFAFLLFGLLVISVLMNLVLFLHIKQVFP